MVPAPPYTADSPAATGKMATVSIPLPLSWNQHWRSEIQSGGPLPRSGYRQDHFSHSPTSGLASFLQPRDPKHSLGCNPLVMDILSEI